MNIIWLLKYNKWNCTLCGILSYIIKTTHNNIIKTTQSFTVTHINIHTCQHTHTCTHTRTHIYDHIHAHMPTLINMFILKHIHKHTYTHTHTHTHTQTYTLTWAVCVCIALYSSREKMIIQKMRNCRGKKTLTQTAATNGNHP